MSAWVRVIGDPERRAGRVVAYVETAEVCAVAWEGEAAMMIPTTTLVPRADLVPMSEYERRYWELLVERFGAAS